MLASRQTFWPATSPPQAMRSGARGVARGRGPEVARRRSSRGRRRTLTCSRSPVADRRLATLRGEVAPDRAGARRRLARRGARARTRARRRPPLAPRARRSPRSRRRRSGRAFPAGRHPRAVSAEREQAKRARAANAATMRTGGESCRSRWRRSTRSSARGCPGPTPTVGARHASCSRVDPRRTCHEGRERDEQARRHVRREQTLNDAARIMWERDCGIVPVVGGQGDDRVVGVITDRDICIAAYTKGRPLRRSRSAT